LAVFVEHISKLYGEQKAVDDISFRISGGEIVGFLGPNGAGKSTTMKILTCFLPQSSGLASVCGFDVVNESMEVRRKVGYLPEHNPLYVDMYVQEYLFFIAALRKLGKSSAARVQKMISLTGLGPEKHKKISQLSKGYRQRVGLAQAMLHEPEVLILDEPTSGLDPNQLTEIRGLIREIGRDKTVILSTHIMQEVEALCSRVMIINKGKIVADDPISVLQGKGSAGAAIVVEFRDPVHSDDIRRIAGISEVELLREKSFRIKGNDIAGIQESIFRLAVEKGTIILSLREEEQKLEHVFRELTARPESPRNNRKKK
jgi:ABC-2 type transport system ATP-binding protein